VGATPENLSAIPAHTHAKARAFVASGALRVVEQVGASKAVLMLVVPRLLETWVRPSAPRTLG